MRAPPALSASSSPCDLSHAGALADSDLGLVRTRLVVVDVELGPLLGRGELVELLELGGDGLGATRPVHPVPEGLAGVALVGEAPYDPHRGLGGLLGRQAQRLVAEVDLLLSDVAAEQHL